MDSGSSRIPASTWKDPAGTQLNRWIETARSDPPRHSMIIHSTKPTTKAAHDMAVANTGPQASVALPPSSSTAEPSTGSATSSQAYAVKPDAACVAEAAPSAA